MVQFDKFDKDAYSLAKLERFLAECVPFRAGLRNGVRLDEQQATLLKTKLYELIYDVETRKAAPLESAREFHAEEWSG